MMPSACLYLSAGIPRSGSTWLFNALRRILNKRFSTYSVWIDDYDENAAKKYEAELIKVHNSNPGLAARAVKIFTTHRDLRDIALSTLDMGWISRDEEIIACARFARLCHEYWQPRSALDVAYRDIVQRPLFVIENLGSALEIEMSQAAAADLATELATLEGNKDSCCAYDKTTLMHVNHRHAGKLERFVYEMPQELQDAILNENRAWLARMGYL